MLRIIALSMIGLTVLAASLPGDVVAPRVTTDQSIDTHDAGTIVAGLCKPAMTDEEKAIAIYNFTRRVMFHYEERGEKNDGVYDLDAIRLLNTYGYSFCTQQMLVMVNLWTAAGVKGTVWSVPGHSTAHAFYGDKLHWFDPLIGIYAFSPKDKTIANLQEIADDPTVLTKAAEQGRIGPGFMPCGRVLHDDAVRLTTAPDSETQYGAGLDDCQYMASVASKAKNSGGFRKSLFKPDMTIRPGEKVTFLWDNIDGEFNVKADAPAKELPPNHFCGVAADEKDKVNFKYWKPYAKEINGVKTCRYYANGRQTFNPVFTLEYFKRGFESNNFAWFGHSSLPAPHMRPKKAGQPANMVYKMSTPYVYTNATVGAEFYRAAAGDVSRLYVSIDAGANWKKVWDAADDPAVKAAPDAGGPVKASANVKDLVRGQRDFWVRAECSTDGDLTKAGLNAISVDAIFQHNMFARPFLGPGKNTVTVATANPETLDHDKLNVTYVWQEDGKEKQDSKRITKSPTEYVIDVAGAEFPKMLRLEMTVLP